jgi:hypothetical protein
MRMVVGGVVLVTILAVASGCVSVALAPGAEQVKTTQNPADVVSCKPVGNVDGNEGNPQPTPENVLHQIQNKTIGLGGNVVFLTTPLGTQGVAYHCN